MVKPEKFKPELKLVFKLSYTPGTDQFEMV